MKNLSLLEKDTRYLTDGGLETCLVYKSRYELNYFSAFELLLDKKGNHELINYYNRYLDIAKDRSLHFIMEAPTWRANPDWAYKMGYTHQNLQSINRKGIDLMRAIVKDHPIETAKVLISGCIGPRGDGYSPTSIMTIDEAQTYHSEQIQVFAMNDADMVSALTINYCNEAIGIAKSANQYGIPVVISFTLETDGKLPDGTNLEDAITYVDQQTDNYISYFMINCAHPEHFKHLFAKEGKWKSRIKGIRANASTLSHAELDASETLEEGDKTLLASGYKMLDNLLPSMQVVGGCCGTDHSHVEEICEHLF